MLDLESYIAARSPWSSINHNFLHVRFWLVTMSNFLNFWKILLQNYFSFWASQSSLYAFLLRRNHNFSSRRGTFSWLSFLRINWMLFCIKRFWINIAQRHNQVRPDYKIVVAMICFHKLHRVSKSSLQKWHTYTKMLTCNFVAFLNLITSGERLGCYR